ncbi:hypothetical protein MTR_2g084420 [Medicago truncatula]|uniref:Uncharacterized protein n=1 Tax=Medicago truncatula TaxID=3880 RepID=A0A072VAW0_MEDTR|nr:hypothetical protein MTR_2g084420 [Medicago truncatula]
MTDSNTNDASELMKARHGQWTVPYGIQHKLRNRPNRRAANTTPLRCRPFPASVFAGGGSVKLQIKMTRKESPHKTTMNKQ